MVLTLLIACYVDAVMGDQQDAVGVVRSPSVGI
jgi:hypothetical protein